MVRIMGQGVNGTGCNIERQFLELSQKNAVVRFSTNPHHFPSQVRPGEGKYHTLKSNHLSLLRCDWLIFSTCQYDNIWSIILSLRSKIVLLTPKNYLFITPLISCQ